MQSESHCSLFDRRGYPKFWKVRSQLYRSRCLQLKFHFFRIRFFRESQIYKIDTLLDRYKRKNCSIILNKEMFRFIPQLLNLSVNFSDVCNISMTFHQTVLFFVEKLTNFARIEGGPRLLYNIAASL